MKNYFHISSAKTTSDIDLGKTDDELNKFQNGPTFRITTEFLDVSGIAASDSDSSSTNNYRVAIEGMLSETTNIPNHFGVVGFAANNVATNLQASQISTCLDVRGFFVMT